MLSLSLRIPVYKDALNTLIRKFVMPKTIVNAHLDKLKLSSTIEYA